MRCSHSTQCLFEFELPGRPLAGNGWPVRVSTVVERRSSIAIANISTMAINWGMTTHDEAARDLLPLPRATFHILVALAESDRHGYGIIQDVEAATGGELRLSAGTLYRSIQRMLEQGLVVETDERPVAALDDARRRYYRITPFGRVVAGAEAARLAQLVRLARASGLVPEAT